MATRFYGSICLTDLIDQAKKMHSSVKKHDKSGKYYVSVDVWINDEADKMGNTMKIILRSADETLRAKEGKVYVGSLREASVKGIKKSNNGFQEFDDLPF